MLSQHEGRARRGPVLRHEPARLEPHAARVAQRLGPQRPRPPLGRLLRRAVRAPTRHIRVIRTTTTAISDEIIIFLLFHTDAINRHPVPNARRDGRPGSFAPSAAVKSGGGPRLEVGRGSEIVSREIGERVIHIVRQPL